MNAQTGDLIWRNDLPDDTITSPSVADGKVYVGSWDKKVYCLDAYSGNKIWSYTTLDRIKSSPVVDGEKVFIGSDDHFLYCLNALNGERIWRYNTHCTVHTTPAVSYGRVLFGSRDSKLHCLNVETGEEIWNYKMNHWPTSPVIIDGKIYVGNLDGLVYCLNFLSGEKIWSYPIGDGMTSSPAVAKGKVFIATNGYEDYKSRFYCLDADTGYCKWSYSVGGHGEIPSSPAVADSKVYIITEKSKVYCFHMNTGRLLWSYILDDDDFMHSSPAIANGKLYVGGIRISSFGKNQPPNNPLASYNNFTDKLIISAIDPDSDKVRYGISWKDNCTVDQWTGFVDSGAEKKIDCDGRTGTIGVIAEDEHGAQSSWVGQKSKAKELKYPIFPSLKTTLHHHMDLIRLTQLQPILFDNDELKKISKEKIDVSSFAFMNKVISKNSTTLGIAFAIGKIEG